MMKYDALPGLVSALLMFGLFMVLCGNICVLFSNLRRKSFLFGTVAFLFVLLNGTMMILFSADVRSRKHDYPPSAASRWLCEKPVIFIMLLFVLMAAFLSYAIIREMGYRKIVVTRSAIKESIDHMTTGLCFYVENGRVVLANHRMNQLCYTILGYDLQNAVHMWENLKKGNLQSGISRLSIGDQPSFRLQDGTVWTFSREELQDVWQITAADTTRLHSLAEELKEKNIALERFNQRLKQYGNDVEDLTREKERLGTKSRIHSELGQTLLATRSYLQGNKEKNRRRFICGNKAWLCSVQKKKERKSSILFKDWFKPQRLLVLQ